MMVEGTWRWVLAVALLAHGVGHVLGLMPLFGVSANGPWHNRSWLLAGGSAEAVGRWLAPAVWLVAVAAFTVVGLGLLGVGVQGTSWRAWAIVAAVVSAVAIVVFWHGFPTTFNKVAALAVDGALLWWVLRLPATVAG
ncbi:MAG: hypothetical protein P8Y02_11285 [Deinococcales bacterium]